MTIEEALPTLPPPACTYADHSYPAYNKRQMLEFAQAAVEAQAREIEALRADRDSWRDQASARVADAVEFADQAAALRADAEQYRWLRAQHWNDGTLAVMRSADLPLGVQTFSGQLLDDAITVRRMATPTTEEKNGWTVEAALTTPVKKSPPASEHLLPVKEKFMNNAETQSKDTT